MDHMLYVAMSGAKQTMLAQAANNNNLANANTDGFRADLNAFRSMPVYGDGYPTRVYTMTERPGFDHASGNIRTTDRQLDISLSDDGWIAVQTDDESEAYTRAGNLRVNLNGILETGAGHAVMGNGGPIAIPQFENIVIGTDGTISIRPIGQAANALVVLDRIKLVKPNTDQLVKAQDGLIRMKNGAVAEADASVRTMAGTLESSNVNTVEAMVNMISLSRHYETQIKMMKAAEEMDSATDRMMQLS